jgi:hypothetical protein
LEDHGPGNQGEEKKKEQNEASDPASLCKNFKDIADVDGAEKKNWKNPSEKRKFSDVRNVAHA